MVLHNQMLALDEDESDNDDDVLPPSSSLKHVLLVCFCNGRQMLRLIIYGHIFCDVAEAAFEAILLAFQMVGVALLYSIQVMIVMMMMMIQVWALLLALLATAFLFSLTAFRFRFLSAPRMDNATVIMRLRDNNARFAAFGRCGDIPTTCSRLAIMMSQQN
mmetsp:Transcript_10292/g.15459  ORF Transcript_10292/g.15459 Transcript_10292/m.15459 type:complete len:161 (-) Transcript_10292:59-541(-)